MTTRWRRTQQIEHDWPSLHEDDWTLVSGTGEQLARIFDSRHTDILGQWRWGILPFDDRGPQGCALTAVDAKRQVEAKLKR
jgi:hypothetical protein